MRQSALIDRSSPAAGWSYAHDSPAGMIGAKKEILRDEPGGAMIQISGEQPAVI
jgi:hypothetical protein